MIPRNTERLLKTLACGTALILLGAAGTVLPAGGAATSNAGLASLDYAFRFATAISSDPKDQAKAQEAVMQDYIARGAGQEAISRVDRMSGWRQATVLADLAASEAKAGRKESAQQLLERAEQLESVTAGWEGPRIQSHIAAALALMGEVKPAREISETLSSQDPRQYKGPAAYTVASGHLMRGELEPAMAELRALDGDPDMDTALWRTRGYLLVGKTARLSATQRLQGMESALESARVLDGWIRIEIAQDAAAELTKLGRSDKARKALDDAQATALALPESLASKAVPMAELARSWGAIGDVRRARDLLKQVEPAAEWAMDIDRPSVYARFASVRRSIGDTGRAEKLTDQALSAAESLRNARPRALAAVDICRFLGRDGIDPQGLLKSRLEGLLTGLKEPW